MFVTSTSVAYIVQALLKLARRVIRKALNYFNCVLKRFNIYKIVIVRFTTTVPRMGGRQISSPNYSVTVTTMLVAFIIIILFLIKDI